MTLAPDGRKLLRIEARNTETPIERKPEWIKTRANMGPEYTRLRSLVKSEGSVVIAAQDVAISAISILANHCH
jgi:lipoate synthase